MTDHSSQKSKTISFFAPENPGDFRIPTKPNLHIPLVFDEHLLEQQDKIIFYVTDNIVVEADPHKYSLAGFDVSEIIESNGYSYANSHFEDSLPVANPFYELTKTNQPGVFEGKENNVSIRLEFSDHAKGRKATLTHQWPDKAPRIREFLTCRICQVFRT